MRICEVGGENVGIIGEEADDGKGWCHPTFESFDIFQEVRDQVGYFSANIGYSLLVLSLSLKSIPIGCN